MRFNAALARRVALILGLSFPTFCTALADGRAVLPPRWMVEAYLSDAVVKPSRDDIARAIIPGLGMVPAFISGGSKDYATWLASVPNKQLIMDASSYSGSDGTPLSTTHWVNSGTAGGYDDRSASYWRTGAHNSMPVVEGTYGAVTSMPFCKTMLGNSDTEFTMWAVHKRGNTAPYASRRDIYTDYSGGFFSPIQMGANGSSYSTRFIAESGGGDTGFITWGPNISAINSAWVVALRARKSDNSLRGNVKGVAYNIASGISQISLPNGGSTYRWISTGEAQSMAYQMEIILAKTAASDQLMDDGVQVLMQKWGIS